MKRSILYLIALLVMTGANAQKIDQRLTRLVEKSDTRSGNNRITQNPQAVKRQIAVVFNADGTPRSMSAIATLKKGEECPTRQLEQMGIEIRYQIGDMVVLNVPADKLLQLEQVEAFSYIRADEMMSKINEKAREASNVEKVNSAAAAAAQQLPKAYTGEGVVIGVIDAGIDYNHAAFRNADGTTRIKKVIDYSGDNKKKVYDTEGTIKALTTDDPSDSHGTHTSAIAGGSDTGNGQQGMAPQAELVLCGLGDYAGGTNIAECIKDIFDYAGSKPAVVNISLSSILGLHDGSDIVCKMAAAQTENGTKAGRAVVIGAGNSADKWQSIIKKMNSTAEELKTVLGISTEPNPSLSLKGTYNANYNLYADDYQDFTVELKVINIKTGEISEVGNHTVDALGSPVPVKVLKTEVPTLAGGTAVVYSLELLMSGVSLDDEALRLAFVVKAGHAGQTIKMICGNENNYEPCFYAPTGLADFTNANGEFAANTIICSDYVISVGSYVTRNTWKDYTNTDRNYPMSRVTGKVQEIGEISDFSSYCVDDNGKARPTLIAPGMGLISGSNNYAKDHFKEGAPGDVNPDMDLTDLCLCVEKFDRKNWYELEQGTSMATPVVTGTVALWMQAKPTLTTNEILSVLKKTCVNDDFTTNVAMIPSGNKVQAGWGKIDCLAGLKEILGATGIETIGIDGHREATPSTMYSVDAPVYNMMGQRVNKNTRGMVIYKGRKYVNK